MELHLKVKYSDEAEFTDLKENLRKYCGLHCRVTGDETQTQQLQSSSSKPSSFLEVSDEETGKVYFSSSDEMLKTDAATPSSSSSSSASSSMSAWRASLKRPKSVSDEEKTENGLHDMYRQALGEEGYQEALVMAEKTHIGIDEKEEEEETTAVATEEKADKKYSSPLFWLRRGSEAFDTVVSSVLTDAKFPPPLYTVDYSIKSGADGPSTDDSAEETTSVNQNSDHHRNDAAELERQRQLKQKEHDNDADGGEAFFFANTRNRREIDAFRRHVLKLDDGLKLRASQGYLADDNGGRTLRHNQLLLFPSDILEMENEDIAAWNALVDKEEEEDEGGERGGEGENKKKKQRRRLLTMSDIWVDDGVSLRQGKSGGVFDNVEKNNGKKEDEENENKDEDASGAGGGTFWWKKEKDFVRKSPVYENKKPLIETDDFFQLADDDSDETKAGQQQAENLGPQSESATTSTATAPGGSSTSAESGASRGTSASFHSTTQTSSAHYAASIHPRLATAVTTSFSAASRQQQQSNQFELLINHRRAATSPTALGSSSAATALFVMTGMAMVTAASVMYSSVFAPRRERRRRHRRHRECDDSESTNSLGSVEVAHDLGK